jgi:ornithine--oxo-acid transaminase
MYPLSGVLGDNDTIDLIDPFEIGSTMAANPPACAAAIAALDVLVDEKLSERAKTLGELLISKLKEAKLPYVKEFMGAGLFWSIILDEELPEGVTPSRIVGLMVQRGLLAGTGKGRVRICPPLTIVEEDLLKAGDIMIGAFRDVKDVGEVPVSASR